MSTVLGRLLEVLLPFGGGIVVIFEAYFDESGSLDHGPRIFAIAGYFIASESARIMDKDWGLILEKHDIPYFHMVDCAHGTGVFVNKSKDERSEIVSSCIALIKGHTLQGFSVLARADQFEATEKDPDIYSSCASFAVAALKVFLNTSRLEGDIAYFFEAGHKSKGRAYNRVAEELDKLPEPSPPVTFAGKQQVRLLQAADLLAWQAVKYVKDSASGERPPRKDFLSLMEHPHDFYFVTMKRDDRAMVVESWPLSRRSERTVLLSTMTDGPIPYLSQEGEEVPIVAVEETFGWRMGGGKMAYIALSAIGGKKFYLAFEQIRLVEAIRALVGATEIYADDDFIPAFPAKTISFHKTAANDEIGLRVQITDRARLTFVLPRDVFERFFKEEAGRPVD